MKVYVLSRYFYDDWEVVSVHSSPEGARQAALARIEKEGEVVHYITDTDIYTKGDGHGYCIETKELED